MNPGWFYMIGCAVGGLLGLAIAGRFDRLTFGFGIATGVAVGFCFVDNSPVWLIPAAVLLVVTIVIGRRKRTQGADRANTA